MGFHWHNLKPTGFYHKGLDVDVFKIGHDFTIDITPYANILKPIPTNAFSISSSYKIQLSKGCASKKGKKIISTLASIE